MILEKSAAEEENILGQRKLHSDERQKIKDQINIKTNHKYNQDKYAIFS